MKSHCFHCQDRIPKGFSASLKIGNEEQYFCCYGCLAIAETIVSGGLENFYKHRTQASEKPDEFNSSDISELQLYDDNILTSRIKAVIRNLQLAEKNVN